MELKYWKILFLIIAFAPAIGILLGKLLYAMF